MDPPPWIPLLTPSAALRHGASSHQGPKRSGFGIPPGFLPDVDSGYYYSAESGYYYDADKKLYFHPTTGLW